MKIYYAALFCKLHRFKKCLLNVYFKNIYKVVVQLAIHYVTHFSIYEQPYKVFPVSFLGKQFVSLKKRKCFL